MALPPNLPQSREAAVRWYTERLTEAAAKGDDVYAEARRWLSRNDLFYLLTVTLKRRDVNRDWLFERCREIQAEPYGCLDLWARGHYKSTIITFAHTIQEILNDPEVTIGIFSDVNKVAKPFLRWIKQEFETNELLKAEFPDILWADPKREAPKWSEDEGIVVKRKGNPKEATVEAYGLIDGQPTGRHFKRLKFDDIVSVETVTTPETMAKVTNRLETADNLGSEGALKQYAGTRYHQNDAYATLIEKGSCKVRIHPATHDGTEHGRPVLLTPEALANKRRDQGVYVFGCQMLLNPTADRAQGFREEWLRYWSAGHTSNLNLYLLIDPASKRKRNSDYTSMFVIGLGPDRNYYVCDMVRDRFNLTGRMNMVFRLHEQWQPKGVGYEEYGLQADIEAIQAEQVRRNYRFDITPLGGGIAKEDRIKRLVPLFENGKLYLPEGTLVRTNWEGHSVDMVRAFVRDEYLSFPVCSHDDMLDCASRILDEELIKDWPKPQSLVLKSRNRHRSPMAG